MPVIFVETKVCKSCEPPQEKPISEFYKGSSRCKSCESKAHKAYYARKRKKAIHRKSNYKILYNITIEQFDEMFREQEGACAICKRDGVKLVVDHDHSTGLARALLCNKCNHGLGRFEDNIPLMYAAIDYLERHANK